MSVNNTILPKRKTKTPPFRSVLHVLLNISDLMFGNTLCEPSFFKVLNFLFPQSRCCSYLVGSLQCWEAMGFGVGLGVEY